MSTREIAQERKNASANTTGGVCPHCGAPYAGRLPVKVLKVRDRITQVFDASVRYAAEIWDALAEDILSRSRRPRFVDPRHAAIYATFQLSRASQADLAKLFGGEVAYGHTTILHALNRVRRKMRDEQVCAESVTQLIGHTKRAVWGVEA